MNRAWMTIAAYGGMVTSGLAQGLEPGDLLVSAFTSDSLVAFNEWTGDLIGDYSGSTDLNGTLGVTLGPDGLVYVASEDANMVLRYDPATRSFVDRFVWDDPDTTDDETGGLDGPSAVLFTPDDAWLLVASFDNDSILRYDATTGAFDAVLVASGSGGLNGPDAGMIIGPDGALYVPSYFGNAVLRYDVSTGAFIDAFVPTNGDGLRRPRQVLFRDGLAYISCESTHRVMRFDAATGVYVDDFVDTSTVNLRSPTGIGFGPDGDFYIGSAFSDEVFRFDGVTGVANGLFIASGTGGLDGITFLYFLPTESLRASPVLPGTAGRSNSLLAVNATPNARVAFVYGFAAGSTPVPGCSGVSVDIASARLGAVVGADETGRAEATFTIPGGASGATVLTQAVEVDACDVSNVVTTIIE